MSFAAGPKAYDRFMGRYSTPLAPLFADFASVGDAQRVLDVGCGPGALTGELVRRVGAESVSAVDPSPGFVEAAAERHPGVDVRRAEAESLPFEDGSFDATLAQLVVHFMGDPAAGIGEMTRVTRPGGIVAACVWDFGGGRGPLGPFWIAARELDPEVDDESERAGARSGQLAELFRGARLRDVQESDLAVRRAYSGFDDWWEPFTRGVGPAGGFLASLDPAGRSQLEAHCRSRLPSGSFDLTAHAWAARGVV